MQTINHDWPKEIARTFAPRARVNNITPLTPDEAAIIRARRLHKRAHAIQCSGLTGTWSELIFSNRADYSALASFTTEASLLGGTNVQPVFPALFFDGTRAFGRTIRLLARGVLSCTGTPTYIFQVRLGTTSGSSYLSGTSVGVTAAITCASGITNKFWELGLDLVCNTPGIGSGNTTLSGAGYVSSPGGFATPFVYALEPTTPDTATWTSTIDNSATQYVNVSVTCSASSASNTITCKQLLCWGWN